MGRVLAVIIWILTLLSVLLFFNRKWWFPEAISEHAPALDRQFLITITRRRHLFCRRANRSGLDGLEVSRHGQSR